MKLSEAKYEYTEIARCWNNENFKTVKRCFEKNVGFFDIKTKGRKFEEIREEFYSCQSAESQEIERQSSVYYETTGRI